MSVIVGVLRAVAAAFLVDLVPALAQVAAERLFRGQPPLGSTLGIVLHMVLLALIIWLVARYHMHMSLRGQLLLPALGILQFFGAVIFGVIYAVNRDGQDRRAAEEEVLAATWRADQAP